VHERQRQVGLGLGLYRFVLEHCLLRIVDNGHVNGVGTKKTLTLRRLRERWMNTNEQGHEVCVHEMSPHQHDRSKRHAHATKVPRKNSWWDEET
jgi:hypothetical protein